MKLYDYWRSTAAYRVRIALNLKGLDYEHVSVSLVKDGGENLKADYKAINPQGKVPALDVGPATLNQSLAIIEYLDETHPEPALLPAGPLMRAKARSFALSIACEVHALNNLAVLKQLAARFDSDADQNRDWMHHWMAEGFAALEEVAGREQGETKFLFGDAPGIAEIFLVAQFYNARRWGVDLTPYPRLVALDEAARAVPAFAKAEPEAQPDAES